MICAIRITAEGQRAVQYLGGSSEQAPNQKRVTVNAKADKLSDRKAIILACAASGKWLPMRALLKRLKTTDEFAEVRKADFNANKLTDELIALSGEGMLRLGRQEPQTCHDCGSTPDRLYAVVTFANDNYDSNEASIIHQSPPICKECFDKK